MLRHRRANETGMRAGKLRRDQGKKKHRGTIIHLSPDALAPRCNPNPKSFIPLGALAAEISFAYFRMPSFAIIAR